ncbi:alcohol dehydrogenase catalytic domain-containing protein [Glutamicibacter sp. MNS18]|uniref:alcohol dehydrogenase catalytic domain-containing protein n=1 Tax=Glutamicibacter sp. MNS18 TaxID=2989817 RepID=UPI0022365D47|nr:alcohol dehydrogenase catalytic domain-containing protein [Glutamicibacter sp. MNS18]MCW4467044.1 alcohol dehydrogenase catalytic domain-containing protein [Glutamicibacter sp. MNS18]
MRANFLFGPGQVALRQVADPVLAAPTDAIVRITASCICGSDLHPYRDDAQHPAGRPIGHEFIGVIEQVGDAVRTVAEGDFVIAPFTVSCGVCQFCAEGLSTSCLDAGYWGADGSAAQAEAIRVPSADGTLVRVPGPVDEALYPSLLTLSDVYATGYHAAVSAGVGPGDTVSVIGDGAVGLLAVLSARLLGASQVILMGRHHHRTELGRRFGATDVVAERGAEGISRVRELSGGHGTSKVLEAVGLLPAYEQALGIVRDGGVISRVGVPQYTTGPVGRELFGRNLTLTGGVAPVRKYIPELLPGVLAGTVNPGLVFDRVLPLEEIAEGYGLMDRREAIKVMIRG